MGRLPGFDYKKPFFYMVTLKRHKGLAAFSAITEKPKVEKDENGRERYLIANAITIAFTDVIRNFATKWRGLWPIETFAIMPDHIHLLLHIRKSGDQLALGKYVYQLEKALSIEYWRLIRSCDCASEPIGRLMPNLDKSLHTLDNREFGMARSVEPIFERDWHDWIVMKDGQLNAFTRYIYENPRRAWLRKQNSRFFGRVSKVSFAGMEWFAYGNTELLDLPVIEGFRCSRKWSEGSEEWKSALLRAMRIGPGGAGVGTFMSPCEKACGNAIYKAGGALIVLSPEGFGERWHPTRTKEALCSKGRLLFLSLRAAENGQPDKATLYKRCHEMGDIILEI